MTDEVEEALLETEALLRVRMVVAYDGTPFYGFAYQTPEVATVARSIRIAIGRLMGYEPELVVAGRTDAGVHAWGQVISLDIPQKTIDRFGLPRILVSVNKQMKPSVVVRSLELAEPDFDARYSATQRRYRYTIHNAPTANPFLNGSAWEVDKELDIDRMNEAAAAIVGEHDFSAFCKKRPLPPGVEEGQLNRSGQPIGHLNRRVDDASWQRLDDDIVLLEIGAKAFCHQMVRSLVGTMVDIGLKDRKVEDMASVLDGKDRKEASTPAPPQGLCLWEVRY